MKELMMMWEETSFKLEELQANPECVREEKESLPHRKEPLYALSYDPSEAVLRQFIGNS